MVKFDNTDAVYKEHAFLEVIAPRRKVLIAKVRRFERGMFTWNATDTMGESPGSGTMYYDFYLLDAEGKLLKKVGRWWIIPFSQTIARAIFALLKKQKRVQYIVYVRGQGVDLYKAPKEYLDITAWLEDILEKEDAE